jgi:ComF family protein
MSIVDRGIGLIAPQLCISCGNEGSVLCDSCLDMAGEPVEPRCAGCHSLSDNSRTCKPCSSWLDVYAVFVATKYEGVYEQLLRSLKFDLKRQAVEPIGSMMVDILENSQIPANCIICPVPTAPSRIRQRGFDHTKLIAKQISSIHNGVKFQTLLGRTSNVRQLGSSRNQRMKQMEQEFYVKQPKNIEGRTILLVDDIMTTGASLSSASKALKKAGAKRVYAVVFAQKV